MVLRLDLDNFKLINETYGHDVGDTLIRRVGERLVDSVPEADTVGRIGGHEFVILGMAALRTQPPQQQPTRFDLVGPSRLTWNGTS